MGTPAGPALWFRKTDCSGGLPRMDAVDVCGGSIVGYGPQQDLVVAARDAAAKQLVIAANGYTSPLAAPDDVAREKVFCLVKAVIDAAATDGATPAVLHCAPDDPLLEVLAELDFVFGVTDTYAVINLPGTTSEDYLAALPRNHRAHIRREIRALAPAVAEVHCGRAAEPFIAEASELVEEAYDERGQHIEATVVAGIYRRLHEAFEDDFLLSMVHLEGKPVASACMLRGAGELLLYSAGIRGSLARSVAGHFNAAYYVPVEFAYANGLRRVLLGPAGIETKRVRGATFVPLISAVPRSAEPLAALLAETDRHMRDVFAGLQPAKALPDTLQEAS